ncbi:hypothetical protein W822_06570 [Advenella kashmirensis W13003]|uniref:Uncharacterized protein n=1 Tax=Advenella kashmirensis W13003 TaxID=1424334 RepID=V8QU17_9BURK|nr:hypothetical protein W822_06570 [Advenella kashmirensis W13003]
MDLKIGQAVMTLAATGLVIAGLRAAHKRGPKNDRKRATAINRYSFST